MQTRVDPNSLAIDANALNSLKRGNSDSPETIRAVARQFESVLMNMMLKSMRDTVPQDGLTDNEQSKMFTGMLDQQLSNHLSQKGLGLTDVLVRQLSKFSPTAAQALDQQAGSAAQSGLNKTTPASSEIPALPSSSNRLTPLNSRSEIAQHADHHSPLNQAQQALAMATQKIRNAYQQWASVQGSEPANDDSAWANSLRELPPLLEETQASLKALTLPPAPLTNAVQTIAGKTQAFIASMLPHAQAASQSSGIPARFMLGQAALESGWGKHEIRADNGVNSHNLFGIKADASWKGKVVNSTTTEYINGIKQTRVEAFRAYDSYADAFKDYARLIANNPRYQQAMQNTHDAGAYATALQRAGYATDPQYGKKLTQVIRQLQG